MTSGGRPCCLRLRIFRIGSRIPEGTPLKPACPTANSCVADLRLTPLALVLLMAAVPLDYGVVLPCSHAGRINGAAK